MENNRAIAEKKIGRKLKDKEVVHYKDLDSGNNDPAEHMCIHRSLNFDWSLKSQELINEVIGEEIHRASEQFTNALKEFFTEKQVYLIYKMVLYTTKCFSKTDAEYYSRTIKPRLRAIQRLNRFTRLIDIMLDDV